MKVWWYRGENSDWKTAQNACWDRTLGGNKESYEQQICVIHLLYHWALLGLCLLKTLEQSTVQNNVSGRVRVWTIFIALQDTLLWLWIKITFFKIVWTPFIFFKLFLVRKWCGNFFFLMVIFVEGYYYS